MRYAVQRLDALVRHAVAVPENLATAALQQACMLP